MNVGRCRLVVGVVGVLSVCAVPGRAGEALKLEAGHPVILACETRSVVVAPEAASSNGTIRLRLDAGLGVPAHWSVIDLASDHTASFAARHKDACKDGCPLDGLTKPKLELWAPKQAALADVAPTQALTIAAIDPVTLKLAASTFLDSQIAALEQGTCAVVP